MWALPCLGAMLKALDPAAMDPSLWKDLLHQGPLVAALVVALVYVFRANEKLHQRLEAVQAEWQAKYEAAAERHAQKAENWAEKGFMQGEKLTMVLDQLAAKRNSRDR